MAALWFTGGEGARLAAALMAVALLVGTAECVCSAGVVRVGAHGAGRGSMLRLRGGSAAAQMAQIRAERAKKFEEEKKKDASNQDSLDEGFEGAGKTWCYATGKVGPATVGTKKMDMPKGDARNFYLDDGATVLRNKRTGMVIELLDGSKGWFLFSTMEGAKVQQISTAGNILSVSRWYVEGMIDDVKANPLRSNFVKAAGIRAGNWKLAVDGRRMVLTNDFWPGYSVHLTEEGFFVIDDGKGEALQFKAAEAEPERMPAADARELLMTC